jgi:hypothetical protein
MTKSEIRLRIVETYPDLPLKNWDLIYDWIMFPEMEAERLEKERIEQEKQEQENQPIEPSPEQINKEKIEEYIRKQKEKNQIIPRT